MTKFKTHLYAALLLMALSVFAFGNTASAAPYGVGTGAMSTPSNPGVTGWYHHHRRHHHHTSIVVHL